MQATAFAAGCAGYRGDAVTTYNTGVDSLNRRYDEAAAAHFGQTAPSFWDYMLHGRIDEYDDAVIAYDGAVEAARQALVAQHPRGADPPRHPRRRCGQGSGWLKEANSGLGARPHPGRDDAADRGRHLPGVDFSSIDFAALQRALGATGRSSFLDPSQFPTASRGQADARPDAPGRRCAPDYAELLQRYYLLTATEKARIYLDGWARARAPTRTCRN